MYCKSLVGVLTDFQKGSIVSSSFFHVRKLRLKMNQKIFGNVRTYNVIVLHTSSSLLLSRGNISWLSGFWRVSFEWKITYMFMACLIRALLSSLPQLFLSLSCLYNHSIFKCFYTHNHFPFWESYFFHFSSFFLFLLLFFR